MAKKMNEIYVVEYSKIERAFDVKRLDEVLDRNLTTLLDNPDANFTYVPLTVTTSWEQAHELKAKIAERLLQTK